MAELLRTVNLGVAVGGRTVIAGADLAVAEAEALALSGPSGAGKSLLARALLDLLPAGATRTGAVHWAGRDLTADPAAWQALRGSGMALMPQEPAAALDPLLTVGAQIAETLAVHGARDVGARTRELLDEVRLPDPDRTARRYPHELSGGQRQRALLAAVLAAGPRLLIADEPTTALDSTIQREIAVLLDEVRRRRGMALLFITHDADLAALLADRRCELREGRIAPAPDAPPAAARAVPAHGTPDPSPVLVARDLELRYPGAGRPAVAGVSLCLAAGRTVGLAGESGCGKSTLARLFSGHLAPDAGAVTLDGSPHGPFTGAQGRRQRRRVQLLFQDPGASLNPRQRVGAALAEAAGSGAPVPGLMAEVDLPPDCADRFPHQLSGGQRQRAALARCLAAEPRALVADEPTSALDRPLQDRVMTLLRRTGAERGLAVLAISHDLSLLRRHCDEIHVMLAGVVVESFAVGEGIAARHPYTQALLASDPARGRRAPERWAELPAEASAADGDDGSGCPFAPRCAYRKTGCLNGLPDLLTDADGHAVRCPEWERAPQSQFIDTL